MGFESRNGIDATLQDSFEPCYASYMGAPVLIIAEIGSVHDGSFGNAMKLIGLAKECGADAVKFQTHIAEAETIRNAPQPPYFTGEPRFEYFKRTGFSLPQWKALKAHADKLKIEFMSSPFSLEAVQLLEKVGMKRYKIPSGEITNIPMLRRIAKTKKQVILSSGMSSFSELDDAVKTIRKEHSDIVILQCTSEYPCPYGQVGLNVLEEMKKWYKCPVGLSDHTLTTYAPLAAVTLGASVIEKHLTFSRTMYGSDAKHSLEPAEFTDMVNGIRAIEEMLVSKVVKDAKNMRQMKQIFEKSVVSVCAIKKGTVITDAMIAVKKPGTGIPARKFEDVIGRKAKRDIAADCVLQEDDVVNNN